jgi:prolipoprotein diacylglyceryltransferase
MPPGAVAHLWLELFAYAVGAQWYRLNLRRSPPGVARPDSLQRWAVIAGAVSGAAVGSKLLYVLQYLPALLVQPAVVWWSGKTIAGGLLGGLIGVEVAKRATGWRASTGDAFVAPLVAGMVIGRLGCQLAGLEDLTYGGVTSLPWGWDYGDGLRRHPVALYEVFGLLLLAGALHASRVRLARVAGDRFRAFMVGYLLLRLALDLLKPPHTPPAAGQLVPALYGSLTAIQWACVAGLAYYLPSIRRWLKHDAR